MARGLILTTCVALLFGCASQQLRQTTTAQQQLDTPLDAGIGDVVLRLDKTAPLLNAFGGADIFGRTRTVGFTEVRFLGLENSGELVFARRDVEILSNESTLSRTPAAISSGTARTTVTSNSAVTTGNAITVGPLPDYHIVVPADSVAIRLQPGRAQLLVEGHRITVVGASPESVRYTITAPVLAP